MCQSSSWWWRASILGGSPNWNSTSLLTLGFTNLCLVYPPWIWRPLTPQLNSRPYFSGFLRYYYPPLPLFLKNPLIRPANFLGGGKGGLWESKKLFYPWIRLFSSQGRAACDFSSRCWVSNIFWYFLKRSPLFGEDCHFWWICSSHGLKPPNYRYIMITSPLLMEFQTSLKCCTNSVEATVVNGSFPRWSGVSANFTLPPVIMEVGNGFPQDLFPLQ